MSCINGCLLGLYEKALPLEMSWVERLTTAKKAGYDFLEISIDETDERISRLEAGSQTVDRICDAIKSINFPVLTMCLSANRKFPVGSENESVRTKGIQIVKDAVDFAIKVGVRIVQLAGYDEYYQERNEKTRALFFDSLKNVLNYAAARGVVLAFETLEIDMMSSIKKISEYVKEANSPYLQIYPDVGNLLAAGKDIEKDFLYGSGKIVGIHLKDALPGKFRDIPYGEGEVDFTAFFKLIKRMNYKGLLVAEMWATQDAKFSIDYIYTARNFLVEKYMAAF